jgi:hypothetical protein
MILPTKNTGLTHQAEDTHGGYFKNAAGVTLAFSHLGGAPVIDCETFFRFYAQVSHAVGQQAETRDCELKAPQGACHWQKNGYVPS